MHVLTSVSPSLPCLMLASRRTHPTPDVATTPTPEEDPVGQFVLSIDPGKRAHYTSSWGSPAACMCPASDSEAHFSNSCVQ